MSNNSQITTTQPPQSIMSIVLRYRRGSLLGSITDFIHWLLIATDPTETKKIRHDKVASSFLFYSILRWSVAVSTMRRQSSRIAAFLQARPMFCWPRSASTARSQVWLGLPNGRFQSGGSPRITAAGNRSKEPQTSVGDQVGERTASGGCSREA